MERIYLDYNGSAPLDPRILAGWFRSLEEERGNPSSIHEDGRRARQKVEESRRTIGHFFQVPPRQVIFTSGGTEGAALLLQGILRRYSTGHVVSSEVEHACVYQTLKAWEGEAFRVTYLPVGREGAVSPAALENALLPETRLIALMAANNETGVLTDLPAVAAIARRAGIPLIVDGVAWLGKAAISIPQGVSALFFSGHKIGAPKGVGFCICPASLKLVPLFLGGEQEQGRRAGTENVSAILALGEAMGLLEREQSSLIAHTQRLRDQFEQQLLVRLPELLFNGLGPRTSNTSNIAFPGVDGETLLMLLDQEGISASHGSACASGALEPSRVLLKMGIPPAQVRASLRFSVGRMTTPEEIERAVAIIVRAVGRLRGRSIHPS